MTAALRDAISAAINEAVLRVTDGTVQFDDEQLRRIGDEFLYGEKTFGLSASIEPYARAAHIVLHDTPFDVLPIGIIRQCCQHKSCGGTTLQLHREETVEGPTHSYRRERNHDYFFGANTDAGLVEKLNDPEWWPNQHDDIVWEYVGKDRFDANAPRTESDLASTSGADRA